MADDSRLDFEKSPSLAKLRREGRFFSREDGVFVPREEWEALLEELSRLREEVAAFSARTDWVLTNSGKNSAGIRPAAGSALPERLEIPAVWSNAQVGRISAQGFEGRVQLREVVIPEGVEVIEPNAFAFCENLERVSLPGTLREIGRSAFQSCAALREVDIPGSVRLVGSDAFLNCARLERVSLWSAGTALNTNAFKGCAALREAELPAGCRSFFNQLELDIAAVPMKARVYRADWVLTRGGRDGAGIRLATGSTLPERLEIPAVWSNTQIRRIAEEAFQGRVQLREVVIPEGVEVIEPSAFAFCENLERVSLPGTLREIGRAAFRACRSLREVDIPAGVRLTGIDAFRDCALLERVVLWGETALGANAFRGCTSLREAELPDHCRAFYEQLDLNRAGIPEGIRVYR